VEFDCCRSTFRGSRIALYIRTDNAKPTPNINIPLCYLLKVRTCTYTKTYLSAQKDNSYPVGHLSLLSPECTEICEIPRSQNKASINAFLICLESPRRGYLTKQVDRPRGNISLPLTLGVRLSTAKVLHYFELSKYFHKKS
jgi:hypothetical protein